MQPDEAVSQTTDEESPEPVEVPWRALSAEALRGVVEAFVLREGTDYGDHEFPHEEKVQQLLNGLERGEARILFDPVTESVTLLPRE
ncbi:MAG TPA: YheU family protein [Steroidobacteraceae bacterium]|nr:YheU family protein [Steroidobacteraceae bacterium]